MVPGADGLEVGKTVVITSRDVIDFGCRLSADEAGVSGKNLAEATVANEDRCAQTLPVLRKSLSSSGCIPCHGQAFCVTVSTAPPEKTSYLIAASIALRMNLSACSGVCALSAPA